MNNKSQNNKTKEHSNQGHAKNTFLILVTTLLTIDLFLIVFIAAANASPTTSGFEDIAGFLNFVFYLLIICAIILTSFVIYILRRNIVAMFVYLGAAAIFASLLSYIACTVKINILSVVAFTVNECAIVPLFTGLMLLLLAAISQNLIKFLTSDEE